MMSDSNVGLTGRQARVVKLSTAVLAAVLLALIIAVAESYALRAAGRRDVSKLACYTVRYSPDSDPTAREIRRAYRCPPARAVPRTPVLLPSPRLTGARPAGTPAVAPSPVTQQQPTPHASPFSAVVPRPSGTSANPQPALSSSLSGSPTPSGSGLLGGLLCDPTLLPICLR